jgi:hypothetical protein
MTRKHYVKTAELIKGTVEQSGHHTPVRKAARLEATREIAESLAVMFAYDNPHFDWNRFMNAAGLGDPNGN